MMKSQMRNRNPQPTRVALAIIKKFVPRVTRVSDAHKDLYLSVTDKDFQSGKKKDHNECALAIAAKRQQHASSVIISASVAYIVKGDHAIRYKLPESARKEIVSFDRGAEFAPGDYVMKAVPNSARFGAIHSDSARSGAHTGNASKRFIHITKNIRDDLKKV